MINRNIRLKKILFQAFFVRIIVLIITLLFSQFLTTGYLRSNYDSDDLRYIDGSVQYSKMANGIIDINAFVQSYSYVDDLTGLSDGIALWYWLMAILMFILRSVILVKLVNIFFAILCIYIIFKLTRKIYPGNIEIAYVAAKLYAFFPYPVFFCCFMYKDQFLCLIILSIYYIVYSLLESFNYRKLMILLSLLITFTLTRDGLLPVILGSIALIVLFSKNNTSQLSIIWRSVFTIVIVFFSLYLLIYNNEIIMHKMNAYLLSRIGNSDYDNTTIKYFLINSPHDIWKLPFTFCVNLIQPIYIGGRILNWEAFVSIFNFVFFPVVIGNFFYFFCRKKSNTLFFYSIMLLYTVVVIVSLGITRQSYFMLPFAIIFYSDFVHGIPNKCKCAKIVNKIVLCVYFLTFLYILIFLPILIKNLLYY